VEKTQPGEQVGDEEVEGAESHDGHDVRGIGEEGMPGDGEDGGDGVEREDDVGEFDGDESEKEYGNHRAVLFADEKSVLAQADGVDASEPGKPAGGVVFFRTGRDDQADGSDEKDRGEEIADPVEAVEEAETGGDEGSAQEDGAGDSPEEDPGLTGGFDVEGAKEEKKDEEIVDGERLFNGIAGEVLGGGLAAATQRTVAAIAVEWVLARPRRRAQASSRLSSTSRKR
jgi:hypothetical protein